MAPKKTKPIIEKNKKNDISETPDTTSSFSTSNSETKSESDNSETKNASNDSKTKIDNSTKILNVNYDTYMLNFEIPKIKENIFDSKANVAFSTNIDYPRFEYGFQHYIHQSKNNFGDNIKMFEKKKQVWRIMNKYETKIDNYTESISDVAKTYFDLKDKPDILSRAFYKLWEIIMSYDLIDLTHENFTSAHLAEGPGSFIQATIFYRDMFSQSKSKNDKYHGVTLHPEGRSFVPEMDKKFINYYESETPKRVFLHKTHSKQISGGDDSKNNGDLTDPKTMRMFGGQIGGKCDFITADGGFETVNENLQEQESFRLIIAEIINAITIQKKGGNFVCKIFETFTKTSMQIISILSVLYDEIKIVKPLTSRASNSEKYVVCMKFKYNDSDKDYKKILSTLENILETMHKNKNDFVVGLFTEFVIPREIILAVTNINLLTLNLQFKSINKTITFIKNEIYSGDEYNVGHQNQKDANKYWIDTFFPTKNEFKNQKTKCEQLAKQMLTLTNAELTPLLKLKEL